jgi:predicted DNA-binding protein
MTTQMIIRLDAEKKKKLSQLARAEGKNASEVVREILDNYIREHDMAGYIDDLWDSIGKDLKKSGATLKDVDRVIKEVRASKR